MNNGFRYNKWFLIMSLTAASLAACDRAPKEARIADAADSLAVEPTAPASSATKAPYAEILQDDSIEFACFFVNPRVHRLGIINIDDDGSLAEFEEWKDSSTVAYIGNAGMYEANRSAKGLLITDFVQSSALDTARSGYGNFYLQPNGVLAIDSTGIAFILPTATFDTMSGPFRYATQSGPMMVVDSSINSLFNQNSPNLNIRNGVGLREDGWLIFAQSLQEVTFYQFAEMMRRQGCAQALYLDGVISRSWFRDLPPHSFGSSTAVGPLVVAFSSIPDTLAHE